MINSMSKRKFYLLLIIILIIQVFFVVFWGSRKERYNIDEIFSYEGAKYGGYSCRYWDIDSAFYGNFHTHKEFIDNFTVYESDYVTNRELVSRLKNEDPYYIFLSFLCKCFPGKTSWWIGIALNIICFVLSQILTYKIIYEITENRMASLASILVAGFSAGYISLLLFSRCYCLLSLLLELMMFLLIRVKKTEKVWLKFTFFLLSLVLTCFCGRLHQLGYLMAGSMLVTVTLYYLFEKDWRTLKIYIGILGIPGLLGALLLRKQLITVIGIAIPYIRSNVTGISFDGFIKSIIKIIIIFSNHFFVNVLGLILIIVMLTLLSIFVFNKNSLYKYIKLMIFPIMTLLCYISAMVIINNIAWRYLSLCYFLIPLIIGGFVTCFDVGGKGVGVFIAFCLGISILGSFVPGNISELFIGEKRQEEFWKQNYPDLDGVMLQANGAGEVWLYEAAFLWPENSKVYVQQTEAFWKDDGFDYYPDADEFVLWLTVDYDNFQVIDEIYYRTDVKSVDMVFSTDSLRAYICRR